MTEISKDLLQLFENPIQKKHYIEYLRFDYRSELNNY